MRKHLSVVLFLLWKTELGKIRLRFLSARLPNGVLCVLYDVVELSHDVTMCCVLVSCVDGLAVLQLWVHLHHHRVCHLHILQSGFSLYPTTSRYTVEPPTTLSITHTQTEKCQFCWRCWYSVCLISSRKRWLRGEKAETAEQKAESDHQAGWAETIMENHGSLQQLWITAAFS